MSAGPSPPDAPPSRGPGAPSITDRVAQLVAEVTGGAAPAPDDDFDAIGVDSLARLELLARLEVELGVELTEDLVGEFRSVNHVARIIRSARDLSVRDHE